MDPAGAIKIINRAELAAAEPEERPNRSWWKSTRRIANPFKAEELGMIDDVLIKPSDAEVLITAFEILANKQYSQPERKHGNIPL